jgi:hypothetical protein
MTANDDTTRPVPTSAPADTPRTGPTGPTGPAAAPAAVAAAPPTTYLEGPAPFPILLGVLGVLLAGGILLAEVTDLSLPWTDLGPWTAVIVGLVVLVVGAIGLSSSRRQG